MFSLLVKLAILIGVLAGVSYAAARVFFRRDRALEDLAQAQRDLRALEEQKSQGLLSPPEYDAKRREIYAWAKRNDLPLDPQLAPPSDTGR